MMMVFSEQLVQPGLLEAVQEKLAHTQMTHSGKKTRSLHHLYITNFLLIFLSFLFFFFLSSASEHLRPNKVFCTVKL